MLFHPPERVFAQAVVDWGFANPFDAAEVSRHEQLAFGVDLPDEVKNRAVPLRPVAWRHNIPVLLQRAEATAEVVRDRVRGARRPLGQGNAEERALYQDLVLFVVYFRYRERLQATLEETLEQPLRGSSDSAPRQGRGIGVTYFEEFVRDLHYYLDGLWGANVSARTAAHWFAGFFQIRRAFLLIHTQIFGNSRPIARLRATVWQSIFTHDMRRYRDLLYDRMHDIATLITGPSGTGKDLVAAAIGLSRYVAFDARAGKFEEDFGGAFHAVNLSALPPQLIESELFGHCKGAFTGAVKDRIGWLESCKRSHSVFLDEIGDLAPAIQVKLLRVLQNRTLERLGETEPRRFEGKVIAATNRNLGRLVSEGAFRRDFYYRLCSDLIQTPSLDEQLRDDPSELPRLVSFITRRLYGSAGAELARDVMSWLERSLGLDYVWPGNMRELEQCIRNVLVRKEYRPLAAKPALGSEAFLARVANLEVTTDELLNWYCTLAHSRLGSYALAARRLGLDRRSLRKRVNKDIEP